MKDRREFRLRKVRSDPAIPFRCDCCLDPITGGLEAVVITKNDPDSELVLVLCGACLPYASTAFEQAAQEAERCATS